MTSVGREQGSQMQQAAADVNAAVSGMSERLNQLFTSLSASNRDGRWRLRSSRAASSKLNCNAFAGSADQRQEQLEQRFSELMAGLSSQLQGSWALRSAAMKSGRRCSSVC